MTKPESDDRFEMVDPLGSNTFEAFRVPLTSFDSRYGLDITTYGEIWVHDVDVGVVLAQQDTWYQITAWSNTVTSFSFDGHNGESKNATPDASNDHITLLASGIYMVEWSVSCYSAAVNKYHFQMRTNNGANGYPNTSAYRTTSTAGAIGNVAGGGICDLDISDTVELWVERKDGAAVSKTVTVRAATLSLHRLL